MSANDPDDYIRREIDWIGVPLKEHKPFLGICLGAQICAAACGQGVSSPPRATPRSAIPDPATSGRPSPSSMPGRNASISWHRERFDLPPGAELLAEGRYVRSAGYPFRERRSRCQFHPDVTHAMMQQMDDAPATTAWNYPGAKPANTTHFGRPRRRRFLGARAGSACFLERWLAGGVTRRVAYAVFRSWPKKATVLV